jgi:AraC-like DNA-binding protein
LNEIVLLPSDQRAAATLIGALDPPHRIQVVGTFSKLEAVLEKAQPLACLMDIFDPAPPIPLNALGQLRRRHPGLAVIIASDFFGREMELYHLGRLRVDGVIRMEEGPTPRHILGVVDRAIAASLATRVVLTCGGSLPPVGQEAIRWAIEHAESRPQVSDLVAAMAVKPRSLSREMRALRLGSPRKLLLWGRLVLASHLLERSAETVEGTAFRLGYSSGGALGKALKRHVGYSPTELLNRGGVELAIKVFREKIVPIET